MWLPDVVQDLCAVRVVAVGTAVYPPTCNYEKFLIKNEKTLKKGLTWDKISDRITFVLLKRHRHGGVAQLARAYGSYP